MNTSRFGMGSPCATIKGDQTRNQHSGSQQTSDDAAQNRRACFALRPRFFDANTDDFAVIKQGKGGGSYRRS